MRFSTFLSALFAWAVLGGAALAQDQSQLSPEDQAKLAKIQRIVTNLHPQYGDVHIAHANATLHLGKDYYFLPPSEARDVLVDVWGNPPDTAIGVQGIVMEAGSTVLGDGWAAVITYEDSGYVADSDASSTNYDELLQQVRDGEDENNADRKAKGYPPMHLVGWAQPPYYDQAHHTLVWAQDLKIEGTPEDSLNYDLRALGRRGVLSMNILAGMSKLKDVRTAAAKLQNVATFDAGYRYQDYKEGQDKLAEYTVGGLVAAGIGALIAKKLGLLALVLVFLKKFFVVILAAFAGAGAWLKRLFTGRKATPEPAPPPRGDLPPPSTS